SAFLPTLAGQGTGDFAAPADRDGRHFAGEVSFTLNQPIFNAPAFPLYWQAKHNLASERWNAVEDLRTLTFDAAHSFLTALASERLLARAQGGWERARADRADTETRVQAGLNSTNDLTRATLAVDTAQSQVHTAEGTLERAYLQLGFIIGGPVKGPLVAPE